ncbi:MAG: hypothetical protein IPP94_19580 [Ignavibacteria bacterium]|nr:hypothetical protein [Ignavibacteria bacterium]
MQDQDMNMDDRLVDAALDSELDAAQEAQLYERLAGDTALRDALRSSRAIRDAARAYPASMTPPAELGTALFARLGIDVAPVVPALPIPRATGLSFINRNGRLILISSIVLLLGGIAWITWNSTNIAQETRTAPDTHTSIAATQQEPARNDASRPVTSANPRQTAISSTEQSPPAATRNLTAARATQRGIARAADNADGARTSTESPAVPPASSGAAPPRGGATRDASGHSGTGGGKQQRSSLAQTAGMEHDASGSTREAQQMRQPETAPVIHRTESSEMTPAASPVTLLPTAAEIARIGADGIPLRAVRELSAPAATPGIGEWNFPQSLRLRQEPLRLNARLRGFRNSSSPAATVGAASDPLFADMAVALAYRIDEEHAIGLEAGQEAFPQNYSGSEEGRSVRYEQNLLTPWFGALYRYRPSWARMSPVLGPFAEAHAGITREWWPQTRLTLGLSYTPFPLLSFEAGLEGTLLAYPFQGSWFTTRKLGVTYGLVVSF